MPWLFFLVDLPVTPKFSSYSLPLPACQCHPCSQPSGDIFPKHSLCIFKPRDELWGLTLPATLPFMCVCVCIFGLESPLKRKASELSGPTIERQFTEPNKLLYCPHCRPHFNGGRSISKLVLSLKAASALGLGCCRKLRLLPPIPLLEERRGRRPPLHGPHLPSSWIASPCRALGSVLMISPSCTSHPPQAVPAEVSAGQGQ